MTKTLFAIVAFVSLGCAFSPANLQNNGTGNGSGTGQKTIPGLTSLTISPTSATVSITYGGPAKTQQYRVTGTVNGHSQDVTDQVGYSLSSQTIVSISSGGLATTLGMSGGVVTITATASGVSASATLKVQYGFTGPDPGTAGQGVPTNSGTIFTTSTNDASRAPQLIYPNDGVLFPPNVTGVEVHFMPGNNNTLFEVSFAGPVSTVNTFIRCQAPQGINGCIYLPDPKIWSSVAVSNAGQGSVTLTVRGTDDNGSSVGNSGSLHMQFARDSVEGAL
ncbi:MAG TPA: hypothetical protein VGP64_02020, partial [Polyangia bacterium]